jgi:hypothetical protein
MTNDNDIRHGRHCVFLMHVHLVFVTKYRREVPERFWMICALSSPASAPTSGRNWSNSIRSWSSIPTGKYQAMVRGARGGTFTAIQRKENSLDYWDAEP